MSSPREVQLKEMFDAYVRLVQGESVRAAALTLGVDNTYVARLRSGWRPTRVRDEIWQRLVAVLASASRQAGAGGKTVREQDVGYGESSRDYYRGKQDTLMDVMKWVVNQQAQIGEHLRRERVVTPTADEVEAGAAILESLPPQRAKKQEQKKRA